MTEEQQMQDEQDRINQELSDMEFDAMLSAQIEAQIEDERYAFESMMDMFGMPEGLLSEPPELFEEANEIPITEEELFYIIREQEINKQEKTQYND